MKPWGKQSAPTTKMRPHDTTPLNPINPMDSTGFSDYKLLQCKKSKLLREATVCLAVMEGSGFGSSGGGGCGGEGSISVPACFQLYS